MFYSFIRKMNLLTTLIICLLSLIYCVQSENVIIEKGNQNQYKIAKNFKNDLITESQTNNVSSTNPPAPNQRNNNQLPFLGQFDIPAFDGLNANQPAFGGLNIDPRIVELVRNNPELIQLARENPQLAIAILRNPQIVARFLRTPQGQAILQQNPRLSKLQFN